MRVTKGKAVGARAAALGAGGGKRSMAYRVKVTPAFSGPLAQHSKQKQINGPLRPQRQGNSVEKCISLTSSLQWLRLSVVTAVASLRLK